MSSEELKVYVPLRIKPIDIGLIHKGTFKPESENKLSVRIEQRESLNDRERDPILRCTTGSDEQSELIRIVWIWNLLPLICVDSPGRRTWMDRYPLFGTCARDTLPLTALSYFTLCAVILKDSLSNGCRWFVY